MPLVTRAQRKECDQIFELVNQAFKIEIGKSGLAYKKCDKYRLKDEARKHLDDMFVVKEGRKVRKYMYSCCSRHTTIKGKAIKKRKTNKHRLCFQVYTM